MKEHTTQPVKVTLPSPMTLADSLFDEHYRDRRTLALEMAKLLNDEACELADAGCDIVQLDEPCFNIYLDDMEEWGIQAVEDVVKGVTAKTAVHVCYGYGVGHWVEWKARNQDWRQYERVLPLLATSAVDQISVECAASSVHSDSARTRARQGACGRRDQLWDGGGRDAGRRRRAHSARIAARRATEPVPVDGLRPHATLTTGRPGEDEGPRRRRSDRAP